MRIALIGGRDNQQFPTVSYGGIETCVENLAWGLHAAGADFSCIVPKRQVRQEYPFEIYESTVPPMGGAESNVWPFARSLPDLVRAARPDVIWSQGFWSAETLKGMGIPIICTFHDILMPGETPYPGWLVYRENTWYRFISKHQFGDWVDSAQPWQQQRCIQLYTGVAEEEYDYSPPEARQDYFLWVGGFKWGLNGKGLDIFIRLAVHRSDRTFILFGAGNQQLHEEMMRLDKKLSNFQYGGPLLRGEQHRAAFKNARLYIMPSRIPDTFPRTVVESMSKGTPVLGTTNGALPEMIGTNGGLTTDSFEEMVAFLDRDQDHAHCYEHSRQFHIDNEIEGLFALSERILTEDDDCGVSTDSIRDVKIK
jgi:glycosyltransferase involved in cell wall biosynthesis